MPKYDMHFRCFKLRRIQQSVFDLPRQMRLFINASISQGCSPFGRLPLATNISPLQG